MRLFAALPLPVAALERLTSLRLRLSAPKDGLRWSAMEQWHITLQFYGDVSGETADCLRSRLFEMTACCPDIVLEELGLFAAKGILVAGVQPSASLAGLHADLQSQGALCGIVPESRAFRPHITLARSKGKVGDGTLRRMSSPTLPAFGPAVRWTSEECLLLESTLGPQGARYTEFGRIPLRNAAALRSGGA